MSAWIVSGDVSLMMAVCAEHCLADDRRSSGRRLDD